MKLAFIVNVPSFFLSHRLPIALEAMRRGWQVAVVAGREARTDTSELSIAAIRANGIELKQAAFSPAGTQPLRELWGLLSTVRQVWRLKPDAVHTASPKGNLYGGIAARLCRVPRLVVAVSGQGFLFTGQATGFKARLARLYQGLMRWVYAHPNCSVIVQNRDDWAALLAQGMLQERQLVWIPGSGVDLKAFMPLQHEQHTVLFPARLLTDKGLREFVAAARQLKAAGYDWQFVLAGEAGAANPAAVSEAQVSEWVAEGCVTWLGHVADMRPVFAEAGIVCLPSYREGMPKALLEAAAAGKPVVTSDAVGCREAIEPGVTGTLVPVADVPALVRALAELMDDPALRQRYGRAGRERAERLFGIGPVVSRHMALYQGHSSTE